MDTQGDGTEMNDAKRALLVHLSDDSVLEEQLLATLPERIPAHLPRARQAMEALVFVALSQGRSAPEARIEAMNRVAEFEQAVRRTVAAEEEENRLGQQIDGSVQHTPETR